MEKKKSRMVWEWVLVLLLYCCGHGDGAAEAEAPSPVTVRSSRVMVSMVFGGITGLGCAVVCAWLVRCVLRYIINRNPILKGAVVFSVSSDKMCRKSLETALINIAAADDDDEERQQEQVHVVEDEDGNEMGIVVKKFEIERERMMIKKKRGGMMMRLQKELEMVGRLRHKNVMRLRGYVNVMSECDRLCLVYDYDYNNSNTCSLEDAMKRARDKELQLGWDGRLRIAVGIIKGLEYLHSAGILHCNLKPANVMLDAEFEPSLGDCGLPNLLLIRNNFNLDAYYNAPECFPNFSIYTEKSDIFSFGVILGMLLTGRDPSDALYGNGNGNGMGKWFRQVVEAGDAREALDKSLLGEEMEEDQMLMAVRIAAVCLSDIPADRPSTHELVPMLTQLHSF